MVWDFFAKLGRQRVNAVQAGMKGKLSGAAAKAKGKAANSFNKAIDGTAKKAKDKAKGAVKGAGKGKAKAKGGGSSKKERRVGIFGRKKGGGGGGGVEPEVEAEAAFGDKTQFIQMVEDERPKEVVGWLVAVNGAQKGQDFRLVPGKNVIGTAADCDVVLTDQYLSARHAVVRYEDSRFVLVDLDSTNGTYVNDDRVAKEEIIDNDSVRLGRTQLKFKALY